MKIYSRIKIFIYPKEKYHVHVVILRGRWVSAILHYWNWISPTGVTDSTAW